MQFPTIDSLANAYLDQVEIDLGSFTRKEKLAGGALCGSWSHFLLAIVILGFSLFMAYIMRHQIPLINEFEVAQYTSANFAMRIAQIASRNLSVTLGTTVLASILVEATRFSFDASRMYSNIGNSFLNAYGKFGVAAMYTSRALRTVLSGLCTLIATIQRWRNYNPEKEAFVTRICAQFVFGSLSGHEARRLITEKYGAQEAKRIEADFDKFMRDIAQEQTRREKFE